MKWKYYYELLDSDPKSLKRKANGVQSKIWTGRKK